MSRNNKNQNKVVEKKVYVREKRPFIGTAISTTLSTSAKVGGGIIGLAKRGYEVSQKKQADPMSRESPYGSKAKYKKRDDRLEKVQLGFPNTASTERMKKTGFKFFILTLLSIVAFSSTAFAVCDYTVGDGEAAMLSCFINFVWTISIGMLISHPLAILYVLLGVIVILVFLAFGAILSGAVTKSINR